MAIITTAVVSTLLGLVTGAIPELVSLFNKKQDHSFELKKLEMESKYATQRSSNRIQELNIEADISEGKSLRDHDASIDGGKFINALRAIIRPLLTLLFFFAWLTVKGLVLWNGLSNDISPIALLPIIWDEDTNVIFFSIIGYWFGTRGMEKKAKEIKNG